MAKVVIALEETDLLDLQEILLDDDERGALDFIKRCISPKIPVRGSGHCDSSSSNPFLLKPEIEPEELN